MACLRFTEDRILGLDPGGASMPFAEPGIDAHYAPSRTFRIAHAHVTLRIDPVAGTYEGTTTFRIVRLPTWRGEARFDLSGVPVQGVTDERGELLPHHLEDDALVVEAGDAERITVAYGQGFAPSAGLYFVGPTEAAPDRAPTAWTQCQDEDAKFFMPCHDHPGVKHPWTIALEGPADCTLLSNGEQTHDQPLDGGWRRVVYEQVGPMPAYLFTAVVGPLEVTTDTWGEVPVRYLVPAGLEDRVERTFGKTPEMMTVFSEFTGIAYPWPRYDQVVVHDFVFGGMENTACTTMTDVLMVDERVGPHWDPEFLVCHELAHQWFGDLVTCRDWSQGWLNESWATFMETVWWSHRHGEAETAWYAHGQMRAYLGEDSGRYRRPIQTYRFREPIDVFDRHLYEKGAVVMRTLMHELGEDAFRAGTQHYLDKHAGGVVHGRDFITAMEDATGANLDRFVHQWIEGAGHPVLEVALDASDGLVTVGVKQTQSGDDTADVFHLTLRIELVLEGGAVQTVDLPVAERSRAWAIPVDGKVAAVRVDPGFRMLAEVKLSGPVRWLRAASVDDCPVLAVRALHALAETGRPDALQVVDAALVSHPRWMVRAEAAGLLAKVRGDAARDTLVSALTSETETRVRAAIAKALGTFREPEAAEALMAALRAEPVFYKEIATILEALGATRDARAAEVLRPYLEVDSVGDVVRRGALTGLANTEQVVIFDDLSAFLETPRADRTRSAVAAALGVLGDKQPDVRTRCREALEQLLDGAGFRTQLAALGALGRLKDPAALGVLQQWHRSAPDGRVRRTAYEALVRCREGRTSDAGLKSIQGRIDGLVEENAKLRARIDKLEKV